jgi:hypothetical protein
MSTIAVFLVLGGATAFAAAELGSNTVGTKQLKGNAVTTGKIKKEAVTGGKIKNGAVSGGKIAAGAITTDKLGATAVNGEKIAGAAITEDKIANNAVTGVKVKDGSLSGTDINQGSLNAVKAANVFGVTFQEVGGAKIINASDPGIKSGGCFLICAVVFPRNVSECSAVASPSGPAGGTGEAAMAEAFPSGSADTVNVVMWNDEGNLIAHNFSMTVVCPNTAT